MKDRFKFRHWDKRINKMFYPERNDNFGYYVNNSDIIETMQCTGLKDKNSKLIYEGDIVKIFHVSGTMQGKYFFDVVEWNDLRCRFDTENYGIINDDDVYEVIGNIYENPELLKEKDQ